jgi:hypothetical protein
MQQEGISLSIHRAITSKMVFQDKQGKKWEAGNGKLEKSIGPCFRIAKRIGLKKT